MINGAIHILYIITDYFGLLVLLKRLVLWSPTILVGLSIFILSSQFFSHVFWSSVTRLYVFIIFTLSWCSNTLIIFHVPLSISQNFLSKSFPQHINQPFQLFIIIVWTTYLFFNSNFQPVCIFIINVCPLKTI